MRARRIQNVHKTRIKCAQDASTMCVRNVRASVKLDKAAARLGIERYIAISRIDSQFRSIYSKTFCFQNILWVLKTTDSTENGTTSGG